jgi:hypothetical protein
MSGVSADRIEHRRLTRGRWWDAALEVLVAVMAGVAGGVCPRHPRIALGVRMLDYSPSSRWCSFSASCVLESLLG